MSDCVFDCSDGTLTFPKLASCLHIDGYKSVQPRKIRGMGNQSILNDYPTVSFAISLDSQDNIQLFYDWWVNTLDYGYKSFKMKTYFMGFEKEINVRITNKLETIPKTLKFWETSIEIEILDDLSGELMAGLEDAICAISGGC